MNDVFGLSPDPSGRPLVVCVDDEPEILRALGRLTRSEPYEFRTTSDPEEALDWARTREVALFIADYRMPMMRGTTLLQLVKAASPETPRMLLTGYPGETMVIAAGEMGLLHLVGKPWDDAALKSMIRGLLDQSGDREQSKTM
jgi:DNA-binding NtrC family response regulator